jgi:hypothetical protein
MLVVPLRGLRRLAFVRSGSKSGSRYRDGEGNVLEIYGIKLASGLGFALCGAELSMS